MRLTAPEPAIGLNEGFARETDILGLSGFGERLAGCGKKRLGGPFPHRAKPLRGVGAGLGAAFAAGFAGLCRFEAETGHGQAAAISFGSRTRL
jgi:hypothetical protein